MTTVTTRKPPRLVHRAFEFRFDDDDRDGRTLEGYAAVFGQPTEISSWEGDFEEEIARGAFKRTLNARTPVMQFDHGLDRRTGSVPIAAIDDMREDQHGLFVKARLFDNETVAPIRDAIAGGAIDGMSFRFRVVDDTWQDKDGKAISSGELDELLWRPGNRGPIRRTIREVELFELGPVVFPAYDGTSVGVRAMLAALDIDDRQRLLDELVASMRAEHPAGDETDPEEIDDEEETDDEEDRSGSEPEPKPARRPTTRLYGEPAVDWHLPTPQIGTGGAI